MKTKKKYGKMILPLVLCVLAATLFAAYRMISSEPSASDTGDTSSEVIMLIDRTADEVAGITYQLSDGEAYAFAFSAADSVWTYTEEPNFPLDQTVVSAMASAVCRIGAYRHLETGDTGEYGFDLPALTVSVTYADGMLCRYAVGDVNPVSGNCYFKDLDTGEVYMIAAALCDYFAYTLDDLFVYDTLPADIEAEYITSFTLDGVAVTDADSIAALYEMYTALTPAAYADPYADEEEILAYGIGEKTLTIDYKTAADITDESGNTLTTRIPATFEIRFGGTAEDGRVYYMLPTSDVVYLAEPETVSTLFAVVLPGK